MAAGTTSTSPRGRLAPATTPAAAAHHQCRLRMPQKATTAASSHSASAYPHASTKAPGNRQTIHTARLASASLPRSKRTRRRMATANASDATLAMSTRATSVRPAVTIENARPSRGNSGKNRSASSGSEW